MICVRSTATNPQLKCITNAFSDSLEHLSLAEMEAIDIETLNIAADLPHLQTLDCSFPHDCFRARNALRNASCSQERQLFLSNSIEQIRALRGLMLANVRLGPTFTSGGRVIGLKLLSELPSTYTSLNLSNCALGAQGVRYLFPDTRTVGIQLRTLNLQRNNLGPQGAAFLASAIEGGLLPELESLVMARNNIGPLGAVDIARAIAHAHALTALNLCENAIGGDSRIDSTMTDSDEEEDDLFQTTRTDIGAVALSIAMRSSNLQRLCVYGNNFDSQSVQCLEDVCAKKLSRVCGLPNESGLEVIDRPSSQYRWPAAWSQSKTDWKLRLCASCVEGRT
jgi:hypothetical protein